MEITFNIEDATVAEFLEEIEGIGVVVKSEVNEDAFKVKVLNYVKEDIRRKRIAKASKQVSENISDAGLTEIDTQIAALAPATVEQPVVIKPPV